MKKTKIHIVSLGCPKNLVDSEVISAGFAKDGFKITPHEEEADIILINTCAFIISAKEESIAEIFRLAEWKAKGSCKYLIVAGCLPQRYGSLLEKEIPEVDLFIGTGEVDEIRFHIRKLQNRSLESRSIIRIPKFLMDSSHQRMILTPSYMAYLKIAEGCSNRCSYCIIPGVRGELRSRQLEDIVAEAEFLASKGVKELILIAQDTTAYGSDLKGKPGLDHLMKSISGIRDIRWIRLLYTHPASLKKTVLETMAREEKICHYIDLPIQHISDEILRSMSRKLGSNQIRKKIKLARTMMPDLALRTSIIVGFPGETTEHFRQLMEFVREIQFDHLGVFTYSKEEGTPAAKFPLQVPEKIKQKRWDLLMEEQAAISFNINRNLIGSVQEVVIEGKSDMPGYVSARGRRQAPEIDGITYVKKKGVKLRTGTFIQCRIVSAGEYDLFAEAL
jgi:ribosomal protein S12 methylthiotransferase